MQWEWLEQEITYDGSQLHSLYAYLNHKILGDSIVSWAGPCRVDFEHMVDGEDLLSESAIEGSRMLHFIVEKFEVSLFSAVALQRLMASICQDLIYELSQTHLLRSGDDLYLDGKKLSISIATQSPVSSLVHFAVNLSNEGTPVPTLCLGDLGIDSEADFASTLMERFASEVDSITQATQKVKWVK